jgi:8-oxo-dGTP pyrophosphatase MutT (NUDIX family)
VKIFINDRFIELLPLNPGKPEPYQLSTEYSGKKKLREDLDLFLADTAFREMLVVSGSMEKCRKALFGFFKLVEAAGGLVQNEKGEFLFIFRMGKWDLPKGKVDKHEKPEDTALREVKEETGLRKLVRGARLPDTFHIYPHKGKMILKQTFWFRMTATSDQLLVPEEAEDIKEARWIKAAELDGILTDAWMSVRDLIQGLPMR